MRTVSLFAMPSHAAIERTSGVDFARVVQPMEALDGWTDGKVKFKVTMYDPKLNAKMDWIKVTEEHDILFLNYTTNAWAFAIMGCMARKNKRKIVLDMDDDLWDVGEDNTAYSAYKKGTEGIANVGAICKEVDFITTTNDYLRNVIAHKTKEPLSKIVVMPNRVNLDLYSHVSPFKDTMDIKLLHFGSSSHFKDLQSEAFNKGLDKILTEYPNVSLMTVGALIPKYKKRWGARYSHGFGDVDIYKWVTERFPIFMDQIDILVTPLTENTYNKCKSFIKFIEGSTAKKPGVWQRVRQYEKVVVEGENGYLAKTPNEWYQSLKRLIDNKKLRKSMGEEAYKTTKRDWQVKDGVDKYAQFFLKVLDA